MRTPPPATVMRAIKATTAVARREGVTAPLLGQLKMFSKNGHHISTKASALSTQSSSRYLCTIYIQLQNFIYFYLIIKKKCAPGRALCINSIYLYDLRVFTYLSKVIAARRTRPGPEDGSARAQASASTGALIFQF